MHVTSAHEIREHLGQLLARKRNYRQEVKEIAERYPHVVFYGCGRNQNGIIDYWNDYIGKKIDFCCDGDSSKWGKTFGGAVCLSPVELAAIKDSCTVFVTIGDFKPVFQSLRESGFPSVHHLYKYDLVASDFLPPEEMGEVLENLVEAHELLADSRSRQVFRAIVERVLSDGTNLDVMSDVCEGDQYFPAGLIEPSDQERLVDGGAFNGDTLRDFVERSKGRFEKVFSFELDAINYKSMEENVQQMPERDRVEIYNLGIWDSEGDISYSVGTYQSSIGFGDGVGHVVALDDVLHDEIITMIKLDIEGAELRGLRGARHLIQTQKPKLAICIYHDFRHLWEIPLYIKSLVPEYKIYLRHHTNLEYETVCYAIP
jgi:FkbM family methyltransferase